MITLLKTDKKWPYSRQKYCRFKILYCTNIVFCVLYSNNSNTVSILKLYGLFSVNIAVVIQSNIFVALAENAIEMIINFRHFRLRHFLRVNYESYKPKQIQIFTVICHIVIVRPTACLPIVLDLSSMWYSLSFLLFWNSFLTDIQKV